MRLVLSTGEIVFCFSVTTVALYISPFFINNDSSAWEFLLIWDDKENFLDNDAIQSGLGFKTLYAMFTMTRINVYEPFGWLLKALQVQIVGLDAWSIRLVSVALHFTAAFVLARASAVLLDLMTVLSDLKTGTVVNENVQTMRERRHSYGCCVSAVVFAIHPVHVEVMGWPSAQPYAQCALFTNLALYVYVRAVYRKLREWADGKRNANLMLMSICSGHGQTDLLCSVLYLSALLSKSVCILLPSGFFLLDVLVYVTLQSQLPKPRAKHFWSYVIGKLSIAATLITFLVIMLMSNYQGMHRDADVLSLTLGERVIKLMTMPVWILHQMLWPSKLRPHYQLRPEELSFANSDCLLSIMALVALLLFTLWLFQYRDAPHHLLALVYFTIMVLPVSGFIQHGMISAGCDRYAYFCSIIVVPYGGSVLSRRLFGVSCKQIKLMEDEKAEKIQNRDLNYQKRPRFMSVSGILLLVGTLLSISTNLMNNWRNEDLLFEYSLRMDPTDWRILDQQAAHYINSKRCTRKDEECRHLWELSYYFTPRGTLKSDLQCLKLLVWLDDLDAACDGYMELKKLWPESCHVHNNVGVCLVRQGELEEARREFIRALQTPGYEHVYATPERNLKRFDKWVKLKEDAQIRGEEDSVPQLKTQIMY